MRELVRERGRALLEHAQALCNDDRIMARRLVTEAVRAAVEHMQTFPEERLDEAGLDALIDNELIEAARKYSFPSGEVQADGCLIDETGEAAVRGDAPIQEKGRIIPYNIRIAMLGVCALAVLWMFIGILMSMGWFPYADIGYTWFNRTLFMVF